MKVHVKILQSALQYLAISVMLPTVIIILYLMKYVVTVAKLRIKRISYLEHMLLMCEIPWHHTGDTKMRKNTASRLQRLRA